MSKNKTRAPRRVPGIVDHRGRTPVKDVPVYAWVPKKDITAYEAGQCTTFVLSNITTGRSQEAVAGLIPKLPPEVARHFTELDPKTGKPVETDA